MRCSMNDDRFGLRMTSEAPDRAPLFERDVFVLPEARVMTETAKVVGTDGEKMSKSYGNTIEIFGDEKTLRKKIMGIVMDSRTPAEPKPDADKNLAIQLLRYFATPEVAADYENRLRTLSRQSGD